MPAVISPPPGLGTAVPPRTPAPPAHGHDRLPRTRSFSRARPLRRWWLAAAIAVSANLVVVVALAQISHLPHATVEPPLALHNLRQLAAPAPPPPPERPRDEEPPPPDEPVAIALPDLDLPTAAPAAALALPALGGGDLTELPLSIPAFAAIGPAAAPPAPSAPAASGPPVFDTQAEREGTFDLDRYYPRSARLHGVTGSTRVRIRIAASGLVSHVQVLESSPAGVFEDAALRLARGIRYRPATAGGVAVESVQDTLIAWTMKK